MKKVDMIRVDCRTPATGDSRLTVTLAHVLVLSC